MMMRVLVVIAATAMTATPVLAQTAPGQPMGPGVPREGTLRPGADRDVTREAANNRALEDDRAVRRPRGGRARPAQVQQAARAAVTQAGVQCEVTAASNPGDTPDGAVYEVACADAPGWLLVGGAASTQAFNCIALADGADEGSARCDLPGNSDTAAAMKGYIRTLGVDCASVEQAVWVGRVGAEYDRYEVQCADGQGYWLEVDLTGRALRGTTCADVATAGGRCLLDAPAA